MKRNNQTMQVIITEINETQVLYKDPTKPKGAAMVMDKSQIKKLVFANGQEEVIAASKPKTDSKSKSGAEKPSFFVTAGGGGGTMTSNVLALLGIKTNLTLSYSAGVGVHIPFGKVVAIAPTATFTQFGGKFSDPTDATSYIKFSYQSAQFAVPVLFTSAPSSARFFGGVGPYLSYAFAGKSIEAESIIGSKETPLNFETTQQPFHFGAMAQIGIKMKAVSVFGYYTRSLSTLERQVNIEPAASTFGIGLKVHF